MSNIKLFQDIKIRSVQILINIDAKRKTAI